MFTLRARVDATSHDTKLIAIIQFKSLRVRSFVFFSVCLFICLFIIIRFGLKSYKYKYARQGKESSRMRVRAHNNIIANDLLIKHFLNVPHMIRILIELNSAV